MVNHLLIEARDLALDSTPRWTIMGDLRLIVKGAADEDIHRKAIPTLEWDYPRLKTTATVVIMMMDMAPRCRQREMNLDHHPEP